MNLTNTLTGTVNLQVEKLWQDNDNALGLRPDEIIVELCANGNPDPTRTLTLTAANDWKGSFDGLAKYDSNGALMPVQRPGGEPVDAAWLPGLLWRGCHRHPRKQ